MPDEKVELTDEQALSLLAKMDVEQKTLGRLWGQFSVAIRQVGSIVTKVQEHQKLLPDLEARRRELEVAIAHLAPDLEARKRQMADDDASARRMLESQLEPLRQQVSEWRARVDQARLDAETFAKDVAARKAALERELAELASRLVQAKADMEAFRQRHGLT
jgi:chromosome segregation ATPase